MTISRYFSLPRNKYDAHSDLNPERCGYTAGKVSIWSPSQEIIVVSRQTIYTYHPVEIVHKVFPESLSLSSGFSGLRYIFFICFRFL